MSGRFLAIAIADPLCEAGGLMAGIGGGLRWAAAPDVVTLPLLAAGVVLLLVGGRRALLLARVAREGREVPAHVFGIGQSWPYRLDYVFRGPDGREVAGRQFVSEKEALRWRKGDTGKVRCDPADSARHVWVAPEPEEALLSLLESPGKPRAQGEATPAAPTRPPPITRSMLKKRVLFGGAGSLYTASTVGIGLLIALALLAKLASLQSLVPPIAVAGGGLVLGVLALVVKLVRHARRNALGKRNVLERGIVTQGSVIGMDEAVMRRSPFTYSLGWDISYSYKDHRGNLHMGQSGRLSRSQAMRYRVGDPCEVVFDPEEPASSFWVSRDP